MKTQTTDEEFLIWSVKTQAMAGDLKVANPKSFNLTDVLLT